MILGELALRVSDLAAMRAFYEDVVGLDVFREGEGHVFLRVADGVEGHPQLLVLFDRGREVASESSTLDHLAFVIGREDYDSRRQLLEAHGIEVTLKEFPSFGWRALFARDPDGNTVEFVCYDPDA